MVCISAPLSYVSLFFKLAMPARSRSRSSVRCARCTHEGEWTSFMRCSRCKVSIYCVRSDTFITRSLTVTPLQSNECQVSDWPYHKPVCTPAPLQEPRVLPHKVFGVTIACNADRARGARAFEVKIIDPSHAIHTQGVSCPLFRQVGFPLVLFRHLRDDPASMISDPGLDNQIAAHLMMHPNTGHPEET